MLRLLYRITDSILAAALQASLSLIFAGIGALLRLLPLFLHLILLGFRGFLILSFRLYHLIFTFLNPVIMRRLKINILTGLSRLVSCLVLSLALGCLFFPLANLALTGLSVALLILHGMVVGLAWDEIENPNGLQLGVRIQ